MVNARVLAVANQKGGVGKTTTSVNLGSALARLGHRVLLIDLDPQGNATSGLGFVPAEMARSVYSVLTGESAAEETLFGTKSTGLDLLPANRDLSGAEVELVTVENRESILKTIVDGLRSKYSYIILDCPPSLGLLTLNALTSADAVVVPLQCEYYALEGLSRLLETLEMVRASLNPALELVGVLLTMFDTRNSICHQVAQEARQHFGDGVFDTVIPRNVRLTESPSHGLPIFDYDPGSRGAESYLEFARELAARTGHPGAGEGA